MTTPPRHWRLLASAWIALAVTACALLLGTRASAALDPGTNAVVRADGDCLRMRAQPSLQGTLLACVPDGSIVTVLAGSVAVDGFQWQRIAYAGQSGWSVELYLQPNASAPPPWSTHRAA